MKPKTNRQRAIRKSLRALIPKAPLADFDEIFERACKRKLRDLEPPDAAFLATVAHVRHRWSDYDELLAEGYDHESARHFVVGDMEDVLNDWGCGKPVAVVDELEGDLDAATSVTSGGTGSDERAS